MKQTIGIEILKKKLPFITVWYNLVILYIFQITLFIGILIFLYWISSMVWYGALIGQSIISFLAIFPLAYITINSDKLRKKYREKYGKLAYQHMWLLFGSYNEPFGSASLYFPAILTTNGLLPKIIHFESNPFTINLLPSLIALPLGIFIILTGFLIRKPTGGYDIDIASYVYIIYPEESRKLDGGLYKFVRNPQYLGRSIICIGLAVIANNLLAFFVALIYFLAFYLLGFIEERELIKRFGESYKIYCKKVPSIFPKYTMWKEFAKALIFGGNKQE